MMAGVGQAVARWINPEIPVQLLKYFELEKFKQFFYCFVFFLSCIQGGLPPKVN